MRIQKQMVSRHWNVTLAARTLIAPRMRGFPSRSFSFASSSIPLTEESPSSVPTKVYNYSNERSDYLKGWAWQRALLHSRLRSRKQNLESSDRNDVVLLLQHNPVYTLGRGADETHLTFLNDPGDQWKLAKSNRGDGSARLAAMDKLLVAEHNVTVEGLHEKVSNSCSPVMAPNGAPVWRIERGGQVTFHGPGQLVVYPLLDLRNYPYKQDLHWYLDRVETVVMETLRYYGIESHQDDEHTGVWVGDCKIAAVGVSCSRWITTHGFAINVDCNLDYFDTSIIMPCGIEGRGVTSMAKVLPFTQTPSMKDVSKVVIDTMQSVFGIDIEMQKDEDNFKIS